jgi:hypothetical protein
MKRRQLNVLLFLNVIVLTISGCSAYPAAAPSLSPPVSATVALTETTTPVHSSVQTVTQSPSHSVDAPLNTEESLLNLQYKDFLNFEGDFTTEKMLSIMAKTMSTLDRSEVGLGVADLQPKLQGYFFNYIEKDGVLLMIMGFDGADGDRFIAPVEIPLYFFEAVSEARITISGYTEAYVSSNEFGSEIYHGDDKSELLSKLDDLRGRVLILNVGYQTYTVDSVKDDGQVAVSYVEELNSKMDCTLKLFQSVVSNNISFKDDEKEVADGIDIVRIENVEETKNIDVARVPVLFYVNYFNGNE